MKRSALRRRTPLRSRSRLRSNPNPVDRLNPARIVWKEPQANYCECGCHTFSLHLHRHHVLERYIVVRERPDLEWDRRNSMLMLPKHHMNHHAAFRRIPISSVPSTAREFAAEVLGQERADLYFERMYGEAEL